MSTPKSWDQVRADALAVMSPSEQAEYDAALIDAELRLQLAELVYDARAAAGLSQAELAARAGTWQSVISAIESGARTPSVIMLSRIAHALGKRLDLVDGVLPPNDPPPSSF